MMRFLLAAVLALGTALSAHAQNAGQLGPGQVWGNAGASAGQAAPTGFSPLLDRALCGTNNDFLIRLSGTWQCGATGTSGHAVPFLDGINIWSGANTYTGGSITGLPAPTNASDAATKQYVDNTASGLTVHTAVALATTAALPANTYNNGTSGVGATLTATANGALSVDGVAVSASQRILIKNEATAANNGIYTVTAAGGVSATYVLTRATDANSPGTQNASAIGFGTYVLVLGGSTQISNTWLVNSAVTTIGTSAINWAQFSAANGVVSIGGQVGVIGLDSTLHFTGSNLGFNLSTASTWTANVTLDNTKELIFNNASHAADANIFEGVGNTLNIIAGTGGFALSGGGGTPALINYAGSTLSLMGGAAIVTTTGQFQSLNGGGISSPAANGQAFWSSSTANGSALIGQGSTNDANFFNKNAATWLSVPTGTINVNLPGNVYIGGGRPWVDVRSGANGCAAAVGDGTTNDQAAIQCQITWVTNNIGAGHIKLPCGNYKVGSTLVVAAPITLVGEGRECSIITTAGADVQAIRYAKASAQVNGGGFRDLEFVCDQSSAATTNCVEVDNLVNATFENFEIIGGNWALYICGDLTCAGGVTGGGADNLYRNGVIDGYGSGGGGLQSHNSANWFYDMKVDALNTTGTGVYLNTDGNSTSTIQESDFFRVDMSGSYSSSAFALNDITSARTTVMMFHPIFGATTAVSLGTFKTLSITGGELGTGTYSISSGRLEVASSVAGNGNGGTITFTGGTRHCGTSNDGVSC